MSQPGVKKLQKGDILFNEGDPSKSMYFVQSGTIRLFKKKGNSSIELALIHKGETIGEMGFLDGSTRSASAEALHETALVEVTGNNFIQQMKALPPWLTILLKTIVGRLRNASKKITQLEAASSAYTYGSQGKLQKTYVYLPINDVLKICSATLLVASHYGQDGAGGSKKFTMLNLQRYANQIMNVSQSKVEEMVDILENVGLAKVDRSVLDKVVIYLMDTNLLELFIRNVNEENLKEAAKQTKYSIKAVIILGFIVKHIDLFPPDNEGVSEINLARIVEKEKTTLQREPFRMEEAEELVKVKLLSDLAYKDGSNVLTKAKPAELVKVFKIQKILKEVDSVNEKKHEQALRGGSGRR